jgi:peptidoglycan/xylan/chitin deacetylase (PgdA/CDA1 family)
LIASLALTFDDGPHPSGTPAVLDALEQAGAAATFFVIAPLAEREPALIGRIQAAGHTIGLHCDAHVRHSERDRSAVAADTETALARMTRLGLAPTLWRTPWGDRAPFTETLAAAYGLSLVDWTVDTHDWRGDAAGEMFDVTRAQLRDGAVVLAHDGIGPGARRSDAAETAAYVGLAAQLASAAGLTLKALG